MCTAELRSADRIRLGFRPEYPCPPRTDIVPARVLPRNCGHADDGVTVATCAYCRALTVVRIARVSKEQHSKLGMG